MPSFGNAGEFMLSIIAPAVVVGVCMGCGLLAGIAFALGQIAKATIEMQKALAEYVKIMRDEIGWQVEPCDDPNCPECRCDPDELYDSLDDLDDELSDSGSFFDPDERDGKPPRKPPRK